MKVQKPKRKPFPTEVVTKVLTASRRRCALCYGLDGDTTEKEGQIAHVDHNSANVTFENAAWLCTTHHARYDSRSRQTKGHTVEELAAYLRMLYEYMTSPFVWPDARSSHARAVGISLEVFDRRVPTYRATVEFVRAVLRGDRLSLDELFKFAASTDEAVFLFDDALAEYLAELYRRANRLRAVHIMIEPIDGREPALVNEWAALMKWFSQQFEVSRSRFIPYLRLAGALPNMRSQPTAPAAPPKRRRG